MQETAGWKEGKAVVRRDAARLQVRPTEHLDLRKEGRWDSVSSTPFLNGGGRKEEE